MTSPTAPRPAWSDVPGRAPAPGRRPLPPRLVDVLETTFVVGVAVIGPADRVAAVWGTRPAAIVVLIGIALAISWRLLRTRSWLVRLGPVVIGSALVWTVGSHQASFWFAIGAVLGSWAMSPPTPAPFLPAPPRSSAVGIAVLALLARHAGESSISWKVPLAFGALGTVLLIGTARWPRAIGEVGHRLGHVVSAALLAVLGVFAVAIPGVLRRAIPHRAFEGTAASTSWDLLDRRASWPARPWMPRAAGRPRSSLVGRVAILAVLVLAAVVVHRAADPKQPEPSDTASPTTQTVPPVAPAGPSADTPATTRPQGTAPTDPGAAAVPAAFANSPWYPTYAADSAYANTWLGLFRQAGYTKLADGGTTYMNVEGGVRRTWRPPTCSCPRLTLWFYGSATAFGLGQRDDFTIPSMLAKAAWEDGIALDVVNKGVPGDQYWRQADRLAWDLASEPAPDLVVFYTGVSDLNAAIYLDQHGLGDRDWPDDLITQSFLDDPVVQALIDQDLRGGATEAPAPPAGVALVEPAAAPALDPAQVGRLATTRLGRTLPMGGEVARLHGASPFWFWEPMRLTRPPVPGEPVLPDDAQLRATVAAANASVPAGVISLADVFDHTTDPLYFDDVHHNEEGAALTAQRIYEHLRQTVAERAGASGGRP